MKVSAQKTSSPGKTFNPGVGMSDAMRQSYIDWGYTPIGGGSNFDAQGNQSPNWTTGGGYQSTSNTRANSTAPPKVVPNVNTKVTPKVSGSFTMSAPNLHGTTAKSKKKDEDEYGNLSTGRVTGGGTIKTVNTGSLQAGKDRSGGTYTWKKGDSFSNIAKSYGLTQAQLREMNGMARGSTIKVGDTFKVPTGAGGKSSTTAVVPGNGQTGGLAKVPGGRVNSNQVEMDAINEYYIEQGAKINPNAQGQEQFDQLQGAKNVGATVSRKSASGGTVSMIKNDDLYADERIKGKPESAAYKGRIRLDAGWSGQPNGMRDFDINTTTAQDAAAYIDRTGGAYTNMGFMKTGADYLAAIETYGVDWWSDNPRADRITQSTAPRPDTPYYDAFVATGYGGLGGATGQDLFGMMYNGKGESVGRTPSGGSYGYAVPGKEGSEAFTQFALPRAMGAWDDNGNMIIRDYPGMDIAQQRSGEMGTAWTPYAPPGAVSYQDAQFKRDEQGVGNQARAGQIELALNGGLQTGGGNIAVGNTYGAGGMNTMNGMGSAGGMPDMGSLYSPVDAGIVSDETLRGYAQNATDPQYRARLEDINGYLTGANQSTNDEVLRRNMGQSSYALEMLNQNQTQAAKMRDTANADREAQINRYMFEGQQRNVDRQFQADTLNAQNAMQANMFLYEMQMKQAQSTQEAYRYEQEAAFRQQQFEFDQKKYGDEYAMQQLSAKLQQDKFDWEKKMGASADKLEWDKFNYSVKQDGAEGNTGGGSRSGGASSSSNELSTQQLWDVKNQAATLMRNFGSDKNAIMQHINRQSKVLDSNLGNGASELLRQIIITGQY